MKSCEPARSHIQAIRSDHLVCSKVVVNVLVTESGDGESVVYVAHHAAVREMKEEFKQSTTYNMTQLPWLAVRPHSISPAVPLAHGPYW